MVARIYVWVHRLVSRCWKKGLRAAPTRTNALLQRHSLHPEISDLADVERAFAATVDRVDGAELLRQLSRPAELADHRAVEAHLVDLAGGIDVCRRIRVRHVEYLAGARRDADRLRVADAFDLALERAVVVEHLDALIAGVSGVDVALRVNRYAVDAGELAVGSGALSPRLDERAVLREFRDACVAESVGHEDVALGVPRHISRTVEQILRCARTSGTPA